MWQRLPSGGNRFHWGVVVRDPCICHLGSRLGSCPYRPSGRLRLSATMNLERVSNEEKLNLCRKYYLDVWRSAVGFLFWVIVLTTWITIFQIYRPRWGALGDYLSFTIPLGTP
uniref:Gamma-secretase subunit PEN-2 n=12 Tax=Boreoeutheria TaxID=1437010 RepID=A0ABI7X121_FELCA